MAVIGREQFQKSGAAVMRARDWLRKAARRRPSRGKPKSNPGAVRGVEIALAVLLGLLLARTALTLLAPLPLPKTPPAAVAPAPEDQLEARHPFRRVSAELEPAPQATEAVVDTSLNLELHGTWVDGAGKGSAIIRLPGGEQKPFSVGEEICCNAKLESVYADRVTILRAGARESLRLPDKSAVPAGPRRTQALTPVAERAANSPKQFAQIVRIQPTKDAAGLFRLALYPAGDEQAFEEQGFRSGDLLVAINNQPAPKDLPSLAQLLSTLRGAKMVNVTVERNGVGVPLEVNLSEGEEGAAEEQPLQRRAQ